MEKLNANEARDYFNMLGLKYSMIKDEHFLVLKRMLEEELLKDEGQFPMRVSRTLKRHYPVYGENGFKHAFLQVDAHYFRRREAISFGEDGFIGFAGWAGNKNVQPMINAFIEWCDWFVKEMFAEPLQKEQVKEE